MPIWGLLDNYNDNDCNDNIDDVNGIMIIIFLILMTLMHGIMIILMIIIISIISDNQSLLNHLCLSGGSLISCGSDNALLCNTIEYH